MPDQIFSNPFIVNNKYQKGDSMLSGNNALEIKEEWKNQLADFVNTPEKLEEYINLTDMERRALQQNKTTWGTTPYFASLMDPDDPSCPIRKQVIPSLEEQKNVFGMDNYLVWKENRATEEEPCQPATLIRDALPMHCWRLPRHPPRPRRSAGSCPR